MNDRHSIIPAVYLMAIKEEKILLIRRYQTGYMDGSYSLPAGHVEQGEFATQALRREIKEEINIELQEQDLTCVHVVHRIKDDERVDFHFIADKWSGEIINKEPHKCDDISWFPLNDLPQNIIPVVKQAIENYQKGIFFSEARF
ncbi:MAG: NUDIX domain-containing protein [Candidatus Magasanikbacteria bacterium]|uniref:NUDIX hydrolase n=1 Tax=Candidatus Magasanikbacteria bacterium CG10_big_fil_rev_8_21_14_0_10_38_6 TaxID=1974647 RepID=A0A2M6P080_9BACT|nr:NUDIX domain-containing protein [Candidatus Magasanikbacteria bacterium]NCS72333.1 NUDIX domain-containing protein [Candidatus Magasanikbacteria bacterium]PIR77088.1 MAG: NUDIX hydrolase [Candidatus Magasanikbacteria bacterium CG10_big_fil_rev_8_21_14_0_10_38_6]